MHNPPHPAALFRDRLMRSDAIGVARIGYDPIRRADCRFDPIDSDVACADRLSRMFGEADHPLLAVVFGDRLVDELAGAAL